MIGANNAEYAVNTPLSDVWMTRKGEASKYRSPVRKDTHDKGHITEEPCEVETLTHGSGAAAGGAIRSPTVTGVAPMRVVMNARVTGAPRKTHRSVSAITHLLMAVYDCAYNIIHGI